MTAVPQFFIPAHWDFDSPLFGELRPAEGFTHPQGPLEERQGRTLPDEPVFFHEDFGIRLSDIASFLKDISPALTALTLAGYRVPTLQIVFPQYTLAALPDHVMHKSRDWWLHLDLVERTVRLEPRDTSAAAVAEGDVAGNDSNLGVGARIYLEKVGALDGEDLGLPLSDAGLQDHANTVDTTGTTERDFLASYIQEPLGSTSADINQQRSWAIEGLARALESGAAYADVHSRLSPEKGAPVIHGVETGAAKVCLDVLRILVFDSITWWVGAELWQQAEEAVEETAALPGGAGAATWPGLLWVLNPATWDSMLPDDDTLGDPPGAYDGVKKVAGVVADILATPHHLKWVSSGKGPAFYDPLVALGQSPQLESEWQDDPEEPDLVLHASPFYYVLQRTLVESQQRRYLGMRGYNLRVLLTEQASEAVQAGDANPWDEVNRRRLKQLRFRTGLRRLIKWRHPGVFSSGELTSMTRGMRALNYVDALLYMFNLGIFSVSDQIGAVSAADYEPHVVATITGQDGDGTITEIRLTHSKSPNSDIRLTMVHPVGSQANLIGLERNVCWQYIPAQPPLADTDTEEMLEKVNPGILEVIDEGKDQVIVVAGPGVSVTYRADFPSTCRVELYRTVTPAQVPPLGTPINTKLLEAPYTISLYDDVRPLDDGTSGTAAAPFEGYAWVSPGSGRRESDPHGAGGSGSAITLLQDEPGSGGATQNAIDVQLPGGTEYAYGEWPNGAPFPQGPQANQGAPFEFPTPQLEDFRERNAIRRDDMPFVTVKPFRDPGPTGHWGVEVVYKLQDATTPNAAPEDRRPRLWGGVKGEATVRITCSKRSAHDRFAFDVRYKVHHGINRTDFSEVLLQHFVLGRFRDFVIGRDDLSLIQFALIIHATPSVEIGIKDNNIADPIWEALWDHFQLEEVETTFDYHIWRTYSGTGSPPAPDANNRITYTDADRDFDAIPDLGSTLANADAPTQTVPRTGRGTGTGHLMRTNVPIEQAQYDANVEMAQFVIDMALGFIPVVGDILDIEDLLIAVCTGQDKWGKPVSRFEQLIMFGAVMLPIVSSRALRGFFQGLPDIGAEDWLDEIAIFLLDLDLD
ncbi:hypothetical protein [Tropicimonas marinistellae]|uniref:hypothetical protein n=1 Tax=Tropicimonas marinistellae TaxID=1739787 RepID=UPI000836D6FE|nr:hypothetical protein [Tropicimonas marinistellae]